MKTYPTARVIMNQLRKQDQEARLYVQLGHRKWCLLDAIEVNPTGILSTDLVFTVDSDLQYARPVEAGVNLLEQTLYKHGPGAYRGARLWFTHQGNHYHVTGISKHANTVTIRTELPRV